MSARAAAAAAGSRCLLLVAALRRSALTPTPRCRLCVFADALATSKPQLQQQPHGDALENRSTHRGNRRCTQPAGELSLPVRIASAGARSVLTPTAIDSACNQHEAMHASEWSTAHDAHSAHDGSEPCAQASRDDCSSRLLSLCARVPSSAAAVQSRRLSSSTAAATEAAAPVIVQSTLAHSHSHSHSHTHTHAASSRSWRLLLLLGCSSLLVGTALGAAGLERHSCENAAAVTPTTAPAGLDEAAAKLDRFYNPPAPPFDKWVSDWDHLDGVPAHIDPATGRPVHVMRHLLFIRHGQYVLPTRETEHLDPILTEKGRQQARLTGARLKSLGYPISAIHVSTMARARETADLIAESFPGLVPQPLALISEGTPCDHVPRHPTWVPSDEEKATEPRRIAQGFETIVQRWREVGGKQVKTKEEWMHAHLALLAQNEAAEAAQLAAMGRDTRRADDEGEDAESGPTQVGANAAAAAATVAASAGAVKSSSKGTISIAPAAAPSSGRSLPPIRIDRYELVVCHGNVIRYSLLRALQLPVQAWLRFSIFNTGISHIRISHDGSVGMHTLGDTGHLPPDMITYH